MKKFAFLIIITLSLFLVGCGNKVKTNQDVVLEQKQSDFSISDCLKSCKMGWNLSNGDEKSRDQYCNSICQAAEGISTNDLSACEKADGGMKDTCYFGIAVENQDPSICKYISEEVTLYSCYINIAQETNDISICEQISSSMRKTACLQGIDSD